jgi:hypothetical protein
MVEFENMCQGNVLDSHGSCQWKEKRTVSGQAYSNCKDCIKAWLPSAVGRERIKAKMKGIDEFLDRCGIPEDERWTILHKDFQAEISRLEKELKE